MAPLSDMETKMEEMRCVCVVVEGVVEKIGWILNLRCLQNISVGESRRQVEV